MEEEHKVTVPQQLKQAREDNEALKAEVAELKAALAKPHGEVVTDPYTDPCMDPYTVTYLPYLIGA